MKTTIAHLTSTFMSPLASIIIILALNILAISCTTAVFDDQVVESPTAPSPQQVTVSLTGFDITTAPMTRADAPSPMTRADESTIIPSNLNRLSLVVFRSSATQGVTTYEPVATFTQKRANPSDAVTTGGAVLGSDHSFGSIQLTLAPGTYTFVCILNEAKAANDDALAAIAPATITSPELASIPGIAVHDTYCYSQSVTITQSTQSISLTMGTRVNARFTLNVTDNVPSGIEKVAFIITPNESAPSGSIELNPTTGCTTSPMKFTGVKTLEEESTTVPEFSMDFYLPEDPYTTDIRVEARDGGNNVLPDYTRTISNVQFTQNRKVTATGHLFDPTASTGFTFSASDWTTANVNF